MCATFSCALSFLVIAALLALRCTSTTACDVLVWPLAGGVLTHLVFATVGCHGTSNEVADEKSLYLSGGLVWVPAAHLALLLGAFVVAGGIDAGAVQVREYSLGDYDGWIASRVAEPDVGRDLVGAGGCGGTGEMRRLQVGWARVGRTEEEDKSGLFVLLAQNSWGFSGSWPVTSWGLAKN